MDNEYLIELAISEATFDKEEIEILHSACDSYGTVCLVYKDKDSTIWYQALEYIKENEEYYYQYGYLTKEKYHYMGDRYKVPSLWGIYFSEVYFIVESIE